MHLREPNGVSLARKSIGKKVVSYQLPVVGRTLQKDGPVAVVVLEERRCASVTSTSRDAILTFLLFMSHHEGTMSGLTVMARAKAKPGREAELEQAMRAIVVPTHQESGCLRYALHRSLLDPSIFMTVEHWTAKEAVDQHFATAHVQALL